MQRRLDVAIALVHGPQVLFLDEPTTGLDPEVRAEMWEEISRLTSEGLTVLLTTHYLEEADRLASQLAIVDRGRVVAEGTPGRAQARASRRRDPRRARREPHADGGRRGGAERRRRDRRGQVDGRVLHARADDGARAVPAVLAALEADGVAVAAVTVARPSLDDVYLRYAGRTFAPPGGDRDDQRGGGR